jgi:tryptophanyl-tRNA synthetase
MLFERIDAEVAPMRSTYQSLIDNPGKIEDILLAGAARHASWPHR